MVSESQVANPTLSAIFSKPSKTGVIRGVAVPGYARATDLTAATPRKTGIGQRETAMIGVYIRLKIDGKRTFRVAPAKPGEYEYWLKSTYNGRQKWHRIGR